MFYAIEFIFTTRYPGMYSVVPDKSYKRNEDLSEKNKRFLLRRTEREMVNVEDLYESLPSFREKSERRYG